MLSWKVDESIQPQAALKMKKPVRLLTTGFFP